MMEKIPSAGFFECGKLRPKDTDLHVTVWRDKWMPGEKNLYKNHNQCKGCVVDYFVDDDDETIEAKEDDYCAISSNVFLEFAQSNDYKRTWVESGLALCITKKTDLFVVYAHTKTSGWLLHATPQQWMDIATAKSYRILDTRPNANGNPDGLFGRGYVVPLEDLLCHPIFAAETQPSSLKQLAMAL